MKAAALLAWRELRARPASTLLAVLAFTVAVAICTATELVHRAREVAVSAEVDAMGAGLRLIPAGRTSRDLARFELGTGEFGEEDLRSLARELSGSVRAVEGRLLVKRALEGAATPLIGIDPEQASASAAPLRELAAGRAVLGAELARRLGRGPGDELRVGATALKVSAVLASTASAEDLALFLDIDDLRAVAQRPGAINEIRVYPLPGREPGDVARDVRSLRPDMSVIVPDNGDGTRRDLDRSLGDLRWVVYGITALVAAFGVLVWSNLNASERDVEMATLVALGGSAWTVLATLGLRVCVVAFAGALLGNALASGIALAQDFTSARSVVGSWDHLLVWPAASAVLGVVGAVPVTLRAAFREHVRALQA